MRQLCNDFILFYLSFFFVIEFFLYFTNVHGRIEYAPFMNWIDLKTVLWLYDLWFYLKQSVLYPVKELVFSNTAKLFDVPKLASVYKNNMLLGNFSLFLLFFYHLLL